MRRKGNGPLSSNALVRKLESGSGNIKNMKLLLPVDGEALVHVTVVGISFHEYASNGVAVLVRPTGGYGTLSISACSLLDDTQAARDLYAAKAGCAEYLRNHTPRDSATLKAWRTAVTRERLALNAKQRKAFDGSAKKYFHEGHDMLKGIADGSEYTLKEVFRAAVAHRFDLGDVQDDWE